MKFKEKFVKKIKIIIKNWNSLYTIISFFLFFYLILVYKLFSYTVLDYKFYTYLADSQQIGKFIVPVNRGTIYSSIEREGYVSEKLSVLGTSVNFYDLAIDPQVNGDKSKLLDFLVNLTYKELCEKSKLKKCKENILKYFKKMKIKDFQNNENYVKQLLSENILKKISKTKLESVSLGNEFTKEQIKELRVLEIVGVYPQGTSIYINPEEFSQSINDIKTISKITSINEESLRYMVKRRKLRYVPIINKLSMDSYEDLKEFKDEEISAIRRGIIKEIDSISSFFIFEPRPTRFYPEFSIASQIIGFVDSEGFGHYGIEGYFNDILKGNNGQIIAKKDVKWRIIEPISSTDSNYNNEGLEIVTTIDRNIQKKVEGILEKGVKKFKANKGTIVVMEPDTGRVLAMANYPTYDLNNYSDVYELERVDNDKYSNPKLDLLGYPIFVEDSLEGKKHYYKNKEIYLRRAELKELGDELLVKYKYKNDYGAGVYKNDAISSLYEPGSIMKSITVAIGIDTGEITPNTKYNDVNKLKIDSFPIKNLDFKKCGGYHTFRNALNFSCNVGMVRIMQKIGKALSHQYLLDFGFGEKTGIELDGEVSSNLKPWEKISKATLFTRSYGLGISVTPLQMASAYSVLANGGIYIKPKIIEKIVYPNGREQIFRTEKLRRVIKESTSKQVIDMLHESSEIGFAKSGKVEGYNVAGKTGTAQINYRGKYQNGPGWTNASYAGFGPVEDPKFVIIVKLERPRLLAYGSQTSATLFKEVASYLFDYFAIPKTSNT